MARLCVVLVALCAVLLPASYALASPKADTPLWWTRESMLKTNLTRVASHWFFLSSPDTVPPLLTFIANETIRTGITSIILDCGAHVDVTGRLDLTLGGGCAQAVQGIKKLGIRAEMALGLANCSIDALRSFSQNASAAGAALAKFQAAEGFDGISLDFEPQSDNCQGSATGTAADAQIFASGLSIIRPQLNANGARLTVCVADWSPLLSQYATLAPSVDRLLDMETYSAQSQASWTGYYTHFVNAGIDTDKMGIGLFPFGASNTSWDATPASVSYRLGHMAADGIAEAFMFRLLPSASPPWPWPMWRQPLADWLHE